ncbi:serine/threonine-protein kinase [Nocardioides sp.]|uniref:serine/threonine-protein kinase n=1 Tax=Nocardioides sp. TaxID=35761 RepID=UPI002D7EDF93|nr:serine/threonine-protein kinase [Nocardioides sp.]HET8959468.1 serine/threonine-protein kinase [Nocardioides sp.]
MSAEEPPVLADRYRLEEILGRGGMAEVWRATDPVLHRSVAVKLLRDTADDETDRQRFTAEARTLARLSHPGLVMLLDAGIKAERPYLVLELVEGRTLEQECGGRPAAPERVAEIGRELAAALAYAHGAGVIHRDVKPSNVLLGHDGRIKLADFGIARLIGETVRHTRTGQAIGTAAYLSPEQVRGEDVTVATDVYSLGLLLLEALTGERAYPGTPTEAALARLSRQPEIPDSLPADWAGLLAQMTSLDDTDRPSADEVVARLREIGRVGTVPESGETRVMTAPVATAPSRPAELLATVRERAAGTPPHLRVVLGVCALIVLFVIIAGLAAGGGEAPADRGIPAQTPPELEQPLQDLHDAVLEGQ